MVTHAQQLTKTDRVSVSVKPQLFHPEIQKQHTYKRLIMICQWNGRFMKMYLVTARLTDSSL